MAVGSRVNPNFPIPGIDQSSRGFRDNFATIKKELEDLQGKRIQLVGGFLSDPVEIGNGTNDVIVPVEINLANVTAAGSNLSVQYNFNGIISGSEVYYNAGRVGINTSLPVAGLHVVGNAVIISSPGLPTYLSVGQVAVISSSADVGINVAGTRAITVGNANLNVGIGTSPTARLDLASNDTDVAIMRAGKDNSDNTVRLSTYQSNSTMGLLLEQRTANKAGGIRIDQSGNISIHANESMDANLSDASRVINILPNNNVGIGSMAPRSQLDVQGNARISGTLVVGSTPPVVSGSRGGNAALASLISALASIGMIVDNTTA